MNLYTKLTLARRVISAAQNIMVIARSGEMSTPQIREAAFDGLRSDVERIISMVQVALDDLGGDDE